MKRKLATYIIYYTDKDGVQGFETQGSQKLFQDLKWLHSKEIGATEIRIYKRGKNFENDQTDVEEAYMEYWKVPWKK